MATDDPRILLAGGGTGGHLFPALAIAEEIRRISPSAAFLFVGTKGKIESRLVPQRGYPFRTIWISGLRRRLSVENLLFPVKVLVALVQSFFVIRRFKPDIVVGTGGYVCGPIVFVASLVGIKTVIHESNSYPGVTTRLLASRATRVFLAFDAAARHLKRRNNIEVTGTPTRTSIGATTREEGLRSFGLERKRKTILVFGGSLGASSINSAVLAALNLLQDAGVQLIWQTGAADYEHVRRALEGRNPGWVGAFIETMEQAYAAADLVVCRAGATTMAELTRAGKPAVLIPYPYAAADHQTFNAKTMMEAGAAQFISDSRAETELGPMILSLIADEQRLARMAAASQRLARPNAGREIAEKVLQLARVGTLRWRERT